MIGRLQRWLERRALRQDELYRLRLRAAAAEAHIIRLEQTLLASERARVDADFARQLEADVGRAERRAVSRILRLESGGAERIPTAPPYEALGDAAEEAG